MDHEKYQISIERDGRMVPVGSISGESYRTATFSYIEEYLDDRMSGGELTAEVTADYLRREHLPDRAFSSEKARYHRPAGTMPEEGVVIQRRYNKSQAA